MFSYRNPFWSLVEPFIKVSLGRLSEFYLEAYRGFYLEPFYGERSHPEPSLRPFPPTCNWPRSCFVTLFWTVLSIYTKNKLVPKKKTLFPAETSLVKMAEKIMGMSTPVVSPRDLFEQSTIKEANRVLSETSHVLNSEYVLMNCGWRVPVCKHKWMCLSASVAVVLSHHEWVTNFHVFFVFFLLMLANVLHMWPT